MDMTDQSARLLSLNHLRQVTEMMTAAFMNDPLWVYLVPDADKRQETLPRFYRVFFNMWLSNRQTFGVGDPLEGLAVWSYPDQKAEFFQLVGPGFLKQFFSPVIMSFVRARNIFAQYEKMQKKYATVPHYYLNTIAVLPGSQGKGLASHLIRPILLQADQESFGIYTETMTPENVNLFEHYGFVCQEDFRVPNTDLTIWSFYRTPATD